MKKQAGYTNFAVLIPAAGNSERMGTDKVTLRRNDGRTFIRYLIDSYLEAGAVQIVVVLNRNTASGIHSGDRVQIVINDWVEKGRSYSILLGMNVIKNNLPCFIQNVDNPFISRNLIDEMLSGIENDAFCVPVYEGRSGHPILLGGNLVNRLRRDSGEIDFKEILKEFKKIAIRSNDELILLNINTEEDYRRYLEMA